MSWIARLMTRLYPGWWRQRYGVELEALVEDSSPTWWTVLDVGKEGLAMQLRDSRSPLYIVLGCALLGAGIGAAVFAATPPRWAFTSSIEVQSRASQSRARRAWPRRHSAIDNLGRLVERFGLYRADQDGQAMTDVLRRFRADISVTLTPAGLDVSFSYPDGAKARQVVENLTRLIIEANLRAAQTDGGRALERYRVTGPPRQAPDGPNAVTLTAFGLGAGLLAGLALAAWRRRAALAAGLGELRRLEALGFRLRRLEMVRGQVHAQQLEGLLRRVGALHEIRIAGVDGAPFDHRIELQDRIPGTPTRRG